MTSTRVLIVAAAPAARFELRSMLEADEEHDFEVVGEVASLELASGLAEADVLLLADEELLEELESSLLEEGPGSIVALAGDEAPVARLRGMPLLGWAVVTPDAPPEEFSAAVHAAARGLVVFPEALAERLLGVPVSVPAAVVDEPSEPLTPREREVLELLGRGLSNRIIAGELHISEHTVKFHVSSLYAKLGVGSRAGAVSQGARRGLISL